MIRVEHLTKRYGPTVAVDDISFHVKQGEIFGFLGPNGAGKTTTMRILTGFLAPTSGSAAISGHDIFSESLAARRDIGYLPETVPLYEDMRVLEYLRFRARLKEIPRSAVAVRVAEAIDRLRIPDVASKLIGHLSKGYRQRVGLAACILHGPKVLILDEPTLGLDPGQIRETRNLIRELGGDHTLLLSTHILPEVEALCEKVMIIDRGRLLAVDTPARLEQALGTGATIQAEARGDADRVRRALEGLEGVESVTVRPRNAILELTIETDGKTDRREEISSALVAAGGVIREFRARRATLEDAFMHITTSEENERR